MNVSIKQTTSIHQQELIEHKIEGEESKTIGSSFYRGKNTNFNPYRRDYKQKDFLQRFLLKGWMPQAPFVSRATKITAFGSCFAANITEYLGSVGYSLSKDRDPDIYISTMGEGLVNVYSLAQQFEWALENTPPPEGLWHGYKAEAFGYDERIRVRSREAFLKTEFFIITLGLSEVWYDELTGGIFWRAVPQANYDETRHKFRVCTLAETKERISYIYRTIRRHVPQAKVLFTLSPVPLAATFRPVSCITANSASKAILRAALDEFIRENQGDLNARLFYFPSYEIISELFFSKFSDDGRHPHAQIIAMIMKLFEAVYCQSDVSFDEVTELYATLRLENAKISVRQAG